MKKNKFVFLAMLYWFPCFLHAQENWGLKDCITYGVKNHRSVKVYANERLAAKAQAKEALAGYLPSVNVTGTIDDNLKVQQSIIPAGLLGPTDTKVAFTKQFNSNAFVQLDQTIYDQSLLTGLKARKYVEQEAQLNSQQNEETIIYNISTAYYQVFVYRAELYLLQANLLTYQEQLKIAELKVKKGVGAEVDRDKIQVNYNNTLSNINVSESNLLLSESQLKNAMGYPLDNALPLDTIGEESAAQQHLIGGEVNTAFDISNRTDYLLSQAEANLLLIDQQKIRAGALPKLSLYAKYGGIGFGDDLGGSFKGISDYAAIGIKLSIPLFDGFKRNAQYTQAKYKQLNAMENLKLDADKYRLEYNNARTKLVKARANVVNDQRNIALAQSVFRSTDLQYQKGVTDLTDWLNAQNSLKEAQNNYLSSLFSFYMATIELEKANGTLKSFYTSL
jgi:outer membrane protein TolC